MRSHPQEAFFFFNVPLTPQERELGAEPRSKGSRISCNFGGRDDENVWIRGMQWPPLVRVHAQSTRSFGEEDDVACPCL